MNRSAILALTLVVAGCSALTLPDADHRAATWALDPASELGAGTTELIAWVTERACASGRSSEGRIIGPDVRSEDAAVVVTFHVRPLPGDQECPGNPPVRVTVRLPQPLGDRRLLDGGREPPREPPICASVESCE